MKPNPAFRCGALVALALSSSFERITPPVAQPEMRQSTTRWQTQKKSLIS